MTETVKRTPGPWALDGNDAFWSLVAPDGERIGIVFKKGFQSSHDARLIVAAPELLEVLKALRDECSGTPRPWVLVDLLSDATEAIAKAEGLSTNTSPE